jgi:DNA-binding IclR family transcriptional regulator
MERCGCFLRVAWGLPITVAFHSESRENMLVRGIQVLQSFRPMGQPQTLSEISRRTGLPKATTHRLVEALIAQDILDRTPEGLVLGRAMFELGELVPIKMRLREAALPFMEDLYEATHETVHLAVRDGLDVLYVEKIRGHSGVDVPSRVGGRLPMSSTGVGKTLLAFSSASLVAEVVSRPLRQLTAKSIADPRILQDELAVIRAAGVGYDHEESKLGVSCVAAPVLVRGEAVAGLSVSVPSTQLQLGGLAPSVRTAALALSRILSRLPDGQIRRRVSEGG